MTAHDVDLLRASGRIRRADLVALGGNPAATHAVIYGKDNIAPAGTLYFVLGMAHVDFEREREYWKRFNFNFLEVTE